MRSIITDDVDVAVSRALHANILAADLSNEANLTAAMRELEGARVLLLACQMRISSRRQRLQGKAPAKGGGYAPAEVPKR